MTLTEQVDHLMRAARAWSLQETGVDVATLDEIGRALVQRAALRRYARHLRGCISTRPCECGLDALLADVDGSRP